MLYKILFYLELKPCVLHLLSKEQTQVANKHMEVWLNYSSLFIKEMFYTLKEMVEIKNTNRTES